MQKRRTHHFKVTLMISLGLSGLLLAVLTIFGNYLGTASFGTVVSCIFAILALATASFLVFSFFPYFRGDKRWYSISALYTLTFFIGSAILWALPASMAVL